MSRSAFALPVCLGLLGAPGAAAAETCGSPGMPCEITDGSYHIRLPAELQGAPIVLYLHGYAASGAVAIRSEALARPLTEAGFVFVAPNGQPDLALGQNLDWGIRDGGAWPRDDVTFLRSVLADAVDRFGLTGDRVLAMGYSRGGSMTWDLACHAPDIATAFAAYAGAFWGPLPDRCDRAVHLYHSHGFADAMVPIEGRALDWHGHAFQMGNLFAGLEIWRQTNGCPERASLSDTTDGWTKIWSDCEAGSIQLELLPGGHDRRTDWAEPLMAWFRAL